MRVLVIGAGVIGCAVAHELARRGADVTIVDRGAVGQGATQASAGMLVPYHEVHEPGAFLTLAARSLAMYDEFIERLASDAGEPVEYTRTGTLHVAAEDDELDALRRLHAALRAAGVESHLLHAAELRELEPHLAAGSIGGLLVPAHGFVAQEAMTDALARAAVLRGAMLLRRSVRRVRSSTTLVADTDQDPIEADRVVIAAGSWSGQVTVDGDRSLPVRPVRGQLLRLEWPHPPLARILWSPRCYLVPRRDGTLLVGATVEDVGFDARATVAGVRDLMDAACDLVPEAWRAGLQSVRVGLRPAAPDDLPVIGGSHGADGVIYATAHYRNGVLLTPITAALVADLVLENRADPILEAFSPGRFA